MQSRNALTSKETSHGVQRPFRGPWPRALARLPPSPPPHPLPDFLPGSTFLSTELLCHRSFKAALLFQVPPSPPLPFDIAPPFHLDLDTPPARLPRSSAATGSPPHLPSDLLHLGPQAKRKSEPLPCTCPRGAGGTPSLWRAALDLECIAHQPLQPPVVEPQHPSSQSRLSHQPKHRLSRNGFLQGSRPGIR